LAGSLGLIQQTISKRLKAMGMIQKKEIRCPTTSSREMLNGVCLLMDSCLKGKEGISASHCN